MRNYWMRIFLGAFAIFAIGMIGVTLVRSGIARVNAVVEGDGPIELPLRFVPFFLEGERLGTLERVVVERDAPRQVESVEIEVNLDDSLVAQGLSECRLAASFESRPGEPGINIHAKRDAKGTFSCLRGDSVPEDFIEFGEAVFQPGEVRVPLFLERELVDDLRQGIAADTTGPLSPEEVDSIAEAARAEVDSALAAGSRGESAGRVGQRLGDSLRAAALARLDSIRRDLPTPPPPPVPEEPPTR